MNSTNNLSTFEKLSEHGTVINKAYWVYRKFRGRGFSRPEDIKLVGLAADLAVNVYDSRYDCSEDRVKSISELVNKIVPILENDYGYRLKRSVFGEVTFEKEKHR